MDTERVTGLPSSAAWDYLRGVNDVSRAIEQALLDEGIHQLEASGTALPESFALSQFAFVTDGGDDYLNLTGDRSSGLRWHKAEPEPTLWRAIRRPLQRLLDQMIGDICKPPYNLMVLDRLMASSGRAPLYKYLALRFPMSATATRRTEYSLLHGVPLTFTLATTVRDGSPFLSPILLDWTRDQTRPLALPLAGMNNCTYLQVSTPAPCFAKRGNDDSYSLPPWEDELFSNTVLRFTPNSKEEHFYESARRYLQRHDASRDELQRRVAWSIAHLVLLAWEAAPSSPPQRTFLSGRNREFFAFIPSADRPGASTAIFVGLHEAFFTAPEGSFRRLTEIIYSISATLEPLQRHVDRMIKTRRHVEEDWMRRGAHEIHDVIRHILPGRLPEDYTGIRSYFSCVFAVGAGDIPEDAHAASTLVELVESAERVARKVSVLAYRTASKKIKFCPDRKCHQTVIRPEAPEKVGAFQAMVSVLMNVYKNGELTEPVTLTLEPPLLEVPWLLGFSNLEAERSDNTVADGTARSLSSLVNSYSGADRHGRFVSVAPLDPTNPDRRRWKTILPLPFGLIISRALDSND